MKNLKKLSVLLALVVCVAFVFTACGGSGTATTAAPATQATEAGGQTAAPAPSGEVVTLTLSIGNPEGSDNWYKYKAFADALEEVSDGMMTAQIYASGTLATDREALNALMGGTVDCAHIIPSAASGTIKDISIMDLPGTFSYPSATDTEAFLDFADKTQDILTSIFEDYGLHFVGLNAPCNAVIVTTYGQVKKPEDCAKQPFRSAGRWLGTLLEQWGASAITLDMSELTTGFERGTITGTLTAYGVIGSNKIYEVAPYITYFHTTNNVAMFVMNGDRWNSFTDEQKAWVNEAAKVFLVKGQAVAQEYYNKYRTEFEGAEGVSVYDLTEAEEAAFFTRISEIYENIAAESTEKGLELISIINEYNGR